MSEQSSPKYWAFISYSSKDRAWGDWLIKAIETYKVPKALVGRPTTRGDPVPRRAFPVFRDRDELPTDTDLGAMISRALEQSRYLIVICSPHSAQSKWVNEEILTFKRLGRADRIFSLIVDGSPNATDTPGKDPKLECYPRALRFAVGPDGNLTTERTHPISADARPHGDGKHNALVKMLAGVLGVNYDDLRQRERVRQRRRRLWMAAGLAVAAVGLVGIQLRLAAVNREKVFQTAQASLASARKSLGDRQPVLAAQQALAALDSVAAAGQQLEPARWVLRRALDANLVEGHWQAHHGEVSECSFDSSGSRLMTFSRDDEEARIWSVPEGRLLSSIKLVNQEGWLAGWRAGANEILTVGTTREGGRKVELAWWNPDNGEQLRKVTLNDCKNVGTRRRPTAGLPEWIVVREGYYSAERYRLVRLRDGEAKAIMPKPPDPGWLPTCVAACGVALLPDQAVGVRLFTIEDGRELGRLEGLEPGKDLHLEYPVASADGTRFAAFVREGKDLREVGVWRAADGGKVISYPKEKLEFIAESTPFMAVAPGGRLLAYSDKLLAALSTPLGRQPVKLPVWDAAGVNWAEDSEVLAVVDPGDRLSLFHPGLELQSDLDTGGARVNSINLSRGGQWLAAGDERGEITLWRTSIAVQIESGLPPTAQLVEVKTPPGGASTGEVLLHSPRKGDRVMVWDLAAGRSTATLAGLVAPEGAFLEFAWNPVDALLVVMPVGPYGQPVPADWQASFYDTKSGRMLGRRPATWTVPAPRGKRALAWGEDHWEVVQAGENDLVVVPLAPIHPMVPKWTGQAAFTPDGEHIVTATNDGWIEIHSALTGGAERSFRFADDLDLSNAFDSINTLTISPSGRWALLCTSNHLWRVNLTDGRSTKIFTTGDRPNGGWAFLNNEQTLVGITSSDLHWWTFPELVPIASVHGFFTPELTIPLTESGELILRAPDREAVIADFRSGSVRSRFTSVLAIDPKGYLAVVEAGNDTQIVRLRDGEVLADLPPVSEACIAADGSRVGLVLRHSDRFVSIPVAVTETALRTRAQQLQRWKSAPASDLKK